MVVCNTHNYFNTNELDEGDEQAVDLDEGIIDILSQMCEVLPLFKSLTIFGVGELDLFDSLVCPTIPGNARSTGNPRVTSGRPMKLAPNQRLLNFIMLLEAW